MIPDPLSAMVAFLRADAQVAALVGTRVYGVELPPGDAASMPRGAVVLSGTGTGGMLSGLGTADYLPAGRRRVDIRSYGSSHAAAIALDLAVYEAMKHMNRAVVNGTLLHGATVESQGITLRDADGQWPLVLSVYLVMAGETVVTVP